MVVGGVLFHSFLVSSGVADLSLEEVAVDPNDFRQKRVLSHSGGAHDDEGLVLQGSRVEGVEVLLCIHVDIILHWLEPLSIQACGAAPTTKSHSTPLLFQDVL